MNLDLTGRIALVTGASRGLGLACAHALAGEGATVAICSRDARHLADAATSILTATGKKVHAFKVDLTDIADVDRMLDRLRDELGSPDILVLSTGHPPVSSLHESTLEDWNSGWSLLLRPAIHLSKQLVPTMTERNYGRVVFVASIFALEPSPESVIQSTLRSGLLGLVKCMSRDHPGCNVTANVVCPGYFATPLVDELAASQAARTRQSAEAILRDWANLAPARRLGSPSEFGALVAFLASPISGYINGSVVRIDGGMTFSSR